MTPNTDYGGHPPPQQIGLVLAGGMLSLPTDASWIAPDRPAYQCRQCGWLLPDLCFRRDHRRRGTTATRGRFHSRCVVCEQENNDAYKRAHRYEIRARAVLGEHRRKERRQGLHGCETAAEYETLTGINVEYLANKMRRTYERPEAECPHCRARWSEMPNGLSDMSVDRRDRSSLLTRENLVLLCRTGNNQKGTLNPRTWEVRQALWRLKRGTGDMRVPPNDSFEAP
jgi:hypothetical protein